MAINDYQNPEDASDPFVAKGKKVNTFAAVTPAAEVQDYIKGLSNQEVIIPVLGAGDVIVDFVKVRVVSDQVNLTDPNPNNHKIVAVYNGESVAGSNCLEP
jgi:hypothetical protein